MKRQEQSYLNAALGLTILGLGGCLSIYNAQALGENPLYYSLRQLLWLTIGIAVFLLLSRIPFRLCKAWALRLGGAAAAGLLLVLLSGTEINGMHGWFSFGRILIQPSDFAKAPYLSLIHI